MTNDDHHSWLGAVAKSVLTAILTTALTLGGSYWLNQQKAKTELAKDVSQRQALALEKLARDLTGLEGSMLYLYKLAPSANSYREMQKQAIDVATLMADIREDNKLLGDSFEARAATHELGESLAPLLAALTEDPATNSAGFTAYYREQFVPKLKRVEVAVENDRKRFVRSLPY